MPRGVYPRRAGFGAAAVQRGARRRELQERQAQEIERLQAHVERQRVALARAAQIISDQRLIQKGAATLARLLPTWGEGRAAHLRVLLGSFAVGAHAGRVAAVTGLPLRTVRELEQPLRRSGIWAADQVVQRWTETGGGRALLSDLEVAKGALYRDPADPTRYGKKPFPPVTTWAKPTRGRAHRKGDVREIDTCVDCQRRPAFMGVCARHLETTHTATLAARLGIKPDTLAKRRLTAVGRCRTCGQGPIRAAGYCQAHYDQHRTTTEYRRRVEVRTQRRRWTPDPTDQPIDMPAPIESDAEAAERRARTALFDRLLADLLASVPPFPSRVGRPRHPIAAVLFGLVTMARLGASTRAVQLHLDAAVATGHLAAPIKPNTLIRYLGADVGMLLEPTRAVLATTNELLAELGVEPAYPTAALPLVVTAEASPIWARLRGVAATRPGRPIAIYARAPVDDEGSVELLLGRIVRSLGKVVALVRDRGLGGLAVLPVAVAGQTCGTGADVASAPPSRYAQASGGESG